jgi:hypothetical protein
MSATWRNRLALAVVAAGVLAGVIAVARLQPVQATQDNAPSTGPRYTVVDTEASNLIVTDNKSNILYFYTIDKDKEIGADLKLRGSIDLNQVGKDAMKVRRLAAGQ